MPTKEHGATTYADRYPTDSAGRGVHSIEGFAPVADESARAAITQTSADRGRTVYQTGGTRPGWYIADGAGGWFYLGGSEAAFDAINDPAVTRPDEFTLIDDLYAIDSDIWTETETGTGDVHVMEGDGETFGIIDADVAGVLWLQTPAGSDAAAIHETNPWFNGACDPVLRARVRTPSDVDDGIFYIGLGNADLESATNYAYFYTEGGYWKVGCGRDGGSTDSATATACSASTWYNLRIEVVGDDEVRFYVNDTLVATLSAANSVPKATNSLGRGIRLFNDGLSNIIAFVDYLDLRLTRANAGEAG